MTLVAGTRLGPYEIQAPLGAGGMGEVYRARDTRLDRTVAIKVLPTQLAADPQFRDRFDREAKAISSLNHPHICTLYDVGHQEGTDFLVMEHLEGGTLAERLEKGPLPMDQALGYGIEIADALDKAHRAGIVHRDLKPGNIMVTKSGTKLLDFGLAKTGAPVVAGASLSTLPTTPPNLTAQGTILGTFQYMAPEQLEGHEADTRSDIFAFGAVLYEMVTGRKAFEGKTQASLIAAILDREPPPISGLQPIAPALLDHIVQRCVAKDPDNRWQSAGDVKRELEWLVSNQAIVQPAGPSARKISRRLMAWATVAVVLVASGGALATIVLRPVTEPPALRLSLLPPDGSTFTNFYQSGTPHFALSPDGRRIAFVAARAGRQRSLWVRPLESTVAQELPGTDDAMSPFWSPDGESLGFFAQGRLKKIGLRDARPETLTSVADGRGGTWSATGVILFGRNAGQLGRIASGGGPVTAVTPSRGDLRISERWPQFLPDGEHFIFDYRQGPEEMEATYLGELNTTEVTPILEPSATAVYAQGFLLFARAGRLQAQRLDTRSWKVVGQPATVLDQIGYAGGSGHPPVSASSNGLLAYWDGTPVRTELLWLDRQGNVLTSVRQPNIYMGLALSPDGQTVALDRRDPQTSTIEVWLHDSRRTFSRFSFGDGIWPLWARDGRSLVFMKGGALVQRSLGGNEKDREVARLGVRGNFPVDSFPDGRTILLETFGGTTAFDLATVTLDDPKPRAILQTAANEVQGRLSPDGKWLAYSSDESGRWEMYVQSFPLTAAKWQISTEGGFQPSWRGDGKELFFLGADLRLMAVSLTTTPAFSSDGPKALFQTRVRPNYEPYPFAYAVTPDGQHFVLNSTELGPGPPISVVTNWMAPLGK